METADDQKIAALESMTRDHGGEAKLVASYRLVASYGARTEAMASCMETSLA